MVLKARSSDSSTSNTVLRERTTWKQRARRRTVLRERKLFVHLCSPFYTSVFGPCTFYLTILEENYRPSISCPPPSVFDSHPDFDPLSISHGQHSLSIIDSQKLKWVPPITTPPQVNGSSPVHSSPLHIDPVKSTNCKSKMMPISI